MERPKTKLEDYYEFRARRDAVERSMVGREVLDTDPKVKNALSEIEKNFKGKINYSDNFEFDTIEEMRQFLLGYKNEHGLADGCT
jgi:hypothetical protein